MLRELGMVGAKPCMGLHIISSLSGSIRNNPTVSNISGDLGILSCAMGHPDLE